MIRFESLGKSYDGHQAVRDFSLSVGSGEVAALLGPNGSGKTTCLKAAAGLLAPTSGRVLVGGVPVSMPEARRSLSFLPQKVSFPEALTGREVVEFYRRLRGITPGRTAEVLGFSSLNGAADRLVGTYSGGMVQRLGLAVAALADGPFLLLDEPTAALDPEGLRAFYALVEQRRREGKSVLFSSHQLGDAERLADRFAILVDGRLVALLSSVELSARLAERGVMRLRLDRRAPGLLEALQSMAPDATWSGEDLLLTGPAALRPALLETVRASGATILSLTTEEGRLEDLYAELVEVQP